MKRVTLTIFFEIFVQVNESPTNSYIGFIAPAFVIHRVRPTTPIQVNFSA